jgi:hypothetical protein
MTTERPKITNCLEGRVANERPKTPPEALRDRLEYDDARLLAECAVHTFRASGPGGQKRNKTSSAVRLHHEPSGLIVKAAESRSQHENKARALRRLRETLAISVRLPLPAEINWPAGVQITEGRLKVSSSNPAINQVLGLVLDALQWAGGRLPEAAARLGVTSSSLTRLLSEHPAAWIEANRIRSLAGLSPLRS